MRGMDGMRSRFVEDTAEFAERLEAVVEDSGLDDYPTLLIASAHLYVAFAKMGALLKLLRERGQTENARIAYKLFTDLNEAGLEVLKLQLMGEEEKRYTV
jgi:hypothetical protein